MQKKHKGSTPGTAREGNGKLAFARGVVFRREPQGGILFNIDTGALQIVEDVAVGICSMIDRGASRREILTELRTRYPEEPRLEEDLDRFLQQLLDRGSLA